MKYDVFISYASENDEVARYMLKRIEERGKRCFYAPRDIRAGIKYAGQLINAVADSAMLLCIYSKYCDMSENTQRELNAAVVRKKFIMTLRLDSTELSPDMEYYVGPTHWMDARNGINDVYIDDIINCLDSTAVDVAPAVDNYKVKDRTIMDVDEFLGLGFTKEEVTLREIELDYLSAPKTKYNVTDEIEGTLESWVESVQEYGDCACVLVENDVIEGYLDMYPISTESYDTIVSGKEMIRESMIELYGLQGEFDAYIPLISINPDSIYNKQNTYFEFFAWIFNKLTMWQEDGIIIGNLGITVYNSIVEKCARAFGFEFANINPAGGKIYTVSVGELLKNTALKRFATK